MIVLVDRMAKLTNFPLDYGSILNFCTDFSGKKELISLVLFSHDHR